MNISKQMQMPNELRFSLRLQRRAERYGITAADVRVTLTSLNPVTLISLFSWMAQNDQKQLDSGSSTFK